MRRKLIIGPLGGLLMQTVVPLDAIGAADKPEDREITEEMIIEFLKNLQVVIKHDELADLAFIERTLGMKAVLVDNFVWPNGDKETRYYLKALKTRLLGQDGIAHHEYNVTQLPQKEPVNGNQAEQTKVYLRLVFSARTHERGITAKDLESVLGKHQFYKEHEAHVSPTEAYLHKEYAYRWKGRNDIGVVFMFSGKDLNLMDVSLYQK